METKELVKWLNKLIQNNTLHEFYTSSEWLKLRAEVLKENKYECAICKQNGKYKRANTVHHVNYVKLHPELALSKTYKDDNKKIKINLLPLCHNCHEIVHDFRRKEKKELLTEEKW